MIWHFEGTMSFSRERIFPNGLLELVLSLEGPAFVVEHDGARLDCAAVNVSGLQLRPMVVVAPTQLVRVLGIRLRPSAARAVLGRALPDLLSTTADLRELAGCDATELAERCHSARTGDECVRVAAAWVEKRIARAPALDPTVADVLRGIDDTGGAARISELRNRVGVSRNRLASTFRAQLGIAPKSYARIKRFDRALRLLHERRGSLSALALETGYYDQAHMSAEFRMLAGRTPSAFVAAQRFPDSLNLAER
jgi:AraC-like DNA-binding protein